MRRLFRLAWVIARRDYTATVFSRTFLLFLIGPLLPLLFGALFGAIAGRDAEPGGRPPIVAAVDAATGHALLTARTRLARQLGEDRLPSLVVVPPSRDPARLLDNARLHPAAVLTGVLDRPLLTGEDPRALRGQVALMIDAARQLRVLGRAVPAAPMVAIRQVDRPHAPRDDERRTLASGAQGGLFVLSVILTGMLISNLVEEKSNKVIEVLAAAAPVDAIFLGKLVGMLGVSLTGIAAWASIAAVAASTFLPPGAVSQPAVGWPMFALLAIASFVMIFLLVGALYLGIGAQAGSVREVQTISMPLTMSQLVIYAFATAAVARPDSAIGIAAAIFPWSSPYAMLGRAATRPALWPHLLAIAWQLAWVAGVIVVAARIFRVTVFKSGGLFRRRRS